MENWKTKIERNKEKRYGIRKKECIRRVEKKAGIMEDREMGRYCGVL